MNLSKFKNLFISEAEDHIQKLNDNLLAFEKNPDDKKILDELMRSSHTIKGSSATMGFKQMAFLTHILEDIFDYARNGMLEITSKTIQELFKTIDLLEESLKSIDKNNKEIDTVTQSQKLKKLTGIATEGVGKSVRDKSGKPIAPIGTNLTISKQQLVKEENISPNADNQILNTEKISYIKVPVERLDNLMDLMEELLIDKMRLQKVLQNLKSYIGNSNNESSSFEDKMSNLTEHLSQLISNIHYQVMQARLVPVEQIFARFPRMVRDLAQEQKKKIDFKITGGEIELDRTIVDKLGEPLVHLLRNAVDHGIEKGGTIKLKAQREKEYVLIVVENSGNGINWQKVIEAAVKRGIIEKNRAGELSEQLANSNRQVPKEVEDLLYHPRLSTKEQITETSGRGVGLSVVKEFVNQMGGRIDLESPLQKGGIRFTMELPLSLAIINALLVQVKDFLFAIPFSNIERSVLILSEDIKSMADQDVAVVNGIGLPLIRLDKIFKISEWGNINLVTQKENKKIKNRNSKAEKQLDKNLKPEIAVLVKRGNDMAGIIIDKLINQQEIIVKPLPNIIKDVQGFSGSTILGDGRIALILDIVGLLEDNKRLVRL